jgi:hypothetical protein
MARRTTKGQDTTRGQLEDEGLLPAMEEAKADSANHELIPWEVVKARRGLKTPSGEAA